MYGVGTKKRATIPRSKPVTKTKGGGNLIAAESVLSAIGEHDITLTGVHE
jgi:hypothetical protein